MAGEYLAQLEHDRAKAHLAALEAKADGSLPAGGMVHDAGGGRGDLTNAGLLRLLDPGSDYDYATQAGDYWRNSTVAACLRVFKANFPQPRPKVDRIGGRGKGKEVAKHELTRLLRRPNEHDDWYTLGSAISLSAICDGNVYLFKIRSSAGKPRELWWVPPWMLEPCWDEVGKDFVSFYRYRVNGRVYRVPPRDVIHWRFGGSDPRNCRKAISELKAAGARAVCSLNEADGFTAALMRNMGIPTVILSPSGPMGGVSFNASHAREIKQAWREEMTGENRGGAFVPIGPMTVTKLNFSPEELALDKLPARLEDQICALTGVPAMMVGVTSGSAHKTYANYGEARQAFYDDTLGPMQAAFASCLTAQLLGEIGIGDNTTQVVAFDYTEVTGLGEDRDKLWARVGKAYKEDQTITRAEAREAMDLDFDPIEDDVYYDEVKPAPEPPTGGDPGDDEDPADEDEEPDDDDEEKPPKPKGKMADPFASSGGTRKAARRTTDAGPRTLTSSLADRVSSRRSARPPASSSATSSA